MCIKPFVVASLVVSVAGSLCSPQGSHAEGPCLNWIERHPVTSPSGRQVHELAYDSARSVVVLFGGWGSSALGDTWEWNGSNWTQAATTGPAPRGENGLAYNSVAQRTFLFGGSNGSVDFDDMWEWDGTVWTSVPIAGPKPSARHHALMVYDSARNVLVLYGGRKGLDGSDPSNYNGETWEWDGSTWTLRCASCPPGPRSGFAMAYDAARSRTVLFGGFNATPPRFGDTWEWDGTSWTLKSSSGPAPRAYPGMAYDADRRVCVLFGGNIPPSYDDTWEWNGSSWVAQSLVESPPVRLDHAMAYDTARHATVLFGGHNFGGFYDDTWVLFGTIKCPTVSQWGLIVMAGLVAVGGGSILAKRRTRTT